MPQRKEYQGVIGARSMNSGGKATVAQRAEAARTAGLDYLVFLEDFASLGPAALEKLEAQCQQASSEKLALIPGFVIDDQWATITFILAASWRNPGRTC